MLIITANNNLTISFVSTYVNIEETGINSVVDPKFYPNPFKDSITISYDLVLPTKVTIIIYSWSGQEIKRSHTEKRTVGEYEFLWDGKDQQNNEVSPGAYVVEIHSKMVSTSQVIIKQ